jgi:hypothetical protein
MCLPYHPCCLAAATWKAIALKASPTQYYCSDQPNGFRCDWGQRASFETFNVRVLGPNQVALSSRRQPTRYCSDQTGGFRCDATAIGPWETFTLAPSALGPYRYTLRSGRTNQYCQWTQVSWVGPVTAGRYPCRQGPPKLDAQWDCLTLLVLQT